MSIITRTEYLRRSSAAYLNPGSTTPTHEHSQYYAQFISAETLAWVARYIDVDELTQALAENQHLNSIPLDRWDQITWAPADGARHSRSTARGNAGGSFFSIMPFDREAILAADETVTRAVLVCIAKETARQLVSAQRTQSIVPVLAPA